MIYEAKTQPNTEIDHTSTMLSKTARYKETYDVIPFYRRYRQAKLSYAVSKHDG